MRLPEKVQRKHFSREEQLLLSSHFESVIPDAADDILYKLHQQQNQSVPTLSTSVDSIKSSAISVDEDFVIDSRSEMEDSTADGFRWMEDDDELDLSLEDYHAHIVPNTDSFEKSASRRPSFRRSLSLTHLPFSSARTSVKAPHPPKPIEPPPILPMLSHQLSNRRSESKDSSLRSALERSVPSSTKHYQDPEARLKLRVYLASPQKFDEALEFGFPSLEDREIIPSRRPSLSKHHTDSVLHTFLNDDNISIFDTYDDKTSVFEVGSTENSPITFLRNPDRLSRSKLSSTDINASYFQPGASTRMSEPYAHVLAGSREMTLRMTLTRPDLRATEEPLYATDDDPLALEHLPIVTNMGDIWDQHPKEGMVKKLWHKMSRKPSAN